MKKRNWKMHGATLCKLAIIILLPQTIKQQGYAITSLVLLGFFVGLYWFPALIRVHEKKWSENIGFWLSFTMLFNTLGFAFNLFDDEICSWWDEVSHFFSFFILGLFATYLIFSVKNLEKVFLKSKRPDWLLFLALLTLGFLWEGLEYSFDLIWDLGMQPSRGDTLIDLLMNALGALLIILLAFRKESGRRKRISQKAAEEIGITVKI